MAGVVCAVKIYAVPATEKILSALGNIQRKREMLTLEIEQLCGYHLDKLLLEE